MNAENHFVVVRRVGLPVNKVFLAGSKRPIPKVSKTDVPVL